MKGEVKEMESPASWNVARHRNTGLWTTVKLKQSISACRVQTQHLGGAYACPTKLKLLTCSLEASVWTFDPLLLKAQARVTYAGDCSPKLSELGHPVLL